MNENHPAPGEARGFPPSNEPPPSSGQPAKFGAQKLTWRALVYLLVAAPFFFGWLAYSTGVPAADAVLWGAKLTAGIAAFVGVCAVVTLASERFGPIFDPRKHGDLDVRWPTREDGKSKNRLGPS